MEPSSLPAGGGAKGGKQGAVGDSQGFDPEVQRRIDQGVEAATMMPQRVPHSARRHPGAEVWGGSQVSGRGGQKVTTWGGSQASAARSGYQPGLGRYPGVAPKDRAAAAPGVKEDDHESIGPWSSVSQQRPRNQQGRRSRSGPGRAEKARERSVDESQENPYVARGAPQEQQRNCEIPCFDRDD